MEDGVLHVVVFPWLAFGHIGPFLELSKAIAKRGHQISFISTPRNIQRLPKIPPLLSPRLDLVSLPLPHIDGLPDGAESTMDIPLDRIHCLMNALDGLDVPVAALLEHSPPDWIIYDMMCYWVPRIAAKFEVPCAHLSIFPASTYAFFGPPSGMISGHDVRDPEKLTVVPPWVPFPSTVAYRRHEAVTLLETRRITSSGVSSLERMGLTLQGCCIVGVRDCMEFGSDWVRLLEDLCQKPVLPLGLLPPSMQDSSSNGEDEMWVEREWLDRQANGSTVYVAFGSEVRPSREQVHGLALGLELSGLPFIWALRSGPQDPDMLPVGFEDRIKDRGIVRKGWVPQLRILGHPSVGGFLTHGGWSSIIEALGFGRPLIVFPMLYDHGLNARIIGEKRIGLEVPRDERDGSFTGEVVAKSLRFVMVDADGEPYRANARKMKEVFGNHKLHDRYMDDFVRYLSDHKRQHRLSSSPSI